MQLTPEQWSIILDALEIRRMYYSDLASSADPRSEDSRRVADHQSAKRKEKESEELYDFLKGKQVFNSVRFESKVSA